MILIRFRRLIMQLFPINECLVTKYPAGQVDLRKVPFTELRLLLKMNPWQRLNFKDFVIQN